MASHSLKSFDLFKPILSEISVGNNPTKPRVFSRADRERMRRRGLEIRPSELDFVIEFPWDATTFAIIVTKTSDVELRRRVLVMALDRIRSTPTMRKILAEKGLPSCTIRENPYLGPGHAPYENFIQSLLTILDASSPGREKLFELLLLSAADEADATAFKSVEEQGARTVFHGTNHAVMDAILNVGLLPSYRTSDVTRDYFGVNYQKSLSFSESKTHPKPTNGKLLVFMIIVAPVVPVSYVGAITVESNTFQLPLAEITLGN